MKLSELLLIVNTQAEDEGLWFISTTAAEAYLQQELRKLHGAIESAVRSQRNADRRDAERYRAFFDAGLPITFLGGNYHDKATLDAAIDAALRSQQSSEGDGR